jgi:hypothetical protein
MQAEMFIRKRVTLNFCAAINNKLDPTLSSQVKSSHLYNSSAGGVELQRELSRISLVAGGDGDQLQAIHHIAGHRPQAQEFVVLLAAFHL